MKVVPAYPTQGLFRRPVRVTQVEELDIPQAERQPAAPPRPAVAPGTTVYVSHSVHLQVGAASKKDSPKKVTLGDFTKNAGIGTGFAGGSLSLIPLAKGTTEAQLAATLKSYGFAPGASDQIASSSLSVARSNLGQISCVFLAGGFATIGFVEALKPDWTWKRKLLYALGGGVVLVLLALLLNYLGIWGEGAQEPNGTAPAATSDVTPK